MDTLISKIEINSKILVYLTSGDILSLPYSYTKRIEQSDVSQLLNYHLIGGGRGIHFDDIDEDISLGGIIEYKLKHELGFPRCA
ncbi:MAG: DUF2442 domain-containing protein [Campylobacterales bacterium]|nr:DUF2442 domain-containing protein [Campylobacterales bacterium]